MKKALFLFSILSLLTVQYGCESKRGEDLGRQEQQAEAGTQDVRPMPQTGPEHGGSSTR